ncbi:hypothetical protein ED92_11030 [Amycolatopsis sp. MJM2582]|uniref:hypothetical protein n=1 Tax=Amycolatopsis sp. MJM2582 TaxID=1427749 RepID=UPI00050330A4|nr:hypothetical protein [Amycolatopsis sp. MJM2582]KFZ80846.1 hypothetical protein ED92_11030 [Amycolatopsis sp. MJM2582]
MPDHDELPLHHTTEPSNEPYDHLGIPVILEAVALATHLITRGVALTTDQLAVALYRVPGDDMPVLLDALHRHRLITDHALSCFVGPAWSHAERPDLTLPRHRWRALFTAAGYTEDGRRVPRPTQPLRLYRGSVADRRDDWSWTESRRVARTYAAGGFGGRLPGAIWTALVEPGRLQACNTDRDEAEFVVDTEGLAISPLSGGAVLMDTCMAPHPTS